MVAVAAWATMRSDERTRSEDVTQQSRRWYATALSVAFALVWLRSLAC